MNPFIKSEDHNGPLKSFSKYKKIKKIKSSNNLDKRNINTPILNPISSQTHKNNGNYTSKVWELALENYNALNQISVYPKSLQIFFNENMLIREEVVMNIKEAVYKLKTPGNNRSYEKKLEKMMCLNQGQELLIEKILQERYFLSENVAHFQEYLCFHKIIQLLKENFNFGQFFHQSYPNTLQNARIQRNSQEKLFHETMKTNDFSNYLSSLYNMKINFGYNFLDNFSSSTQTPGFMTPFDFFPIEKNFEKNLFMNSEEKFNFLNLPNRFRMKEGLKFDLKHEQEK